MLTPVPDPRLCWKEGPFQLFCGKHMQTCCTGILIWQFKLDYIKLIYFPYATDCTKRYNMARHPGQLLPAESAATFSYCHWQQSCVGVVATLFPYSLAASTFSVGTWSICPGHLSLVTSLVIMTIDICFKTTEQY